MFHPKRQEKQFDQLLQIIDTVKKSRIGLHDTVPDAMYKMSEGNPGALSVLMQILEKDSEIDPDAALAGFGTVLAMDDMGLYGSEIWILYKDICGQKIENLLAVLRARQLGFIDKEAILAAVKFRGAMKINVPDLMAKVQKRLPNFNRKSEEMPNVFKEEKKHGSRKNKRTSKKRNK